MRRPRHRCRCATPAKVIVAPCLAPRKHGTSLMFCEGCTEKVLHSRRGGWPNCAFPQQRHGFPGHRNIRCFGRVRAACRKSFRHAPKMNGKPKHFQQQKPIESERPSSRRTRFQGSLGCSCGCAVNYVQGRGFGQWLKVRTADSASYKTPAIFDSAPGNGE